MRAQILSAPLLLLLLGSLASACPLAARQSVTAVASASDPGPTDSGTAGDGPKVDMVAIIKNVLPTSDSCAGADFPDECRTAEQAAPYVSKACADLSDAECAATLAVMGYESADFKYKHNLGNNPGQGTANMMSPENVLAYATDLFGADKVAGKTPNEVLAMVTPDETNFGSAAWHLKTKCPSLRDALKTGTDAAWERYMNECIMGDKNPKRLEYWNRAKNAFGL
ncbi:uncharacterized protein P884DRAFT_276553 [Thermothelomyces heterothallicus CBS 202.75]|uniref:uncharacterized protein n=1 Tax=Thermothelomyces heterothallicus CBS 202.75 TaxID=1149848 RepID=UPI0037422B7E